MDTGHPRAESQEVESRVGQEMALQLLLASTSAVGSPEFFHTLVRHLGEVFRVTCSLVVRLAGQDGLQPVAIWNQGAFHEDQTLALPGTAFEQTLSRGFFHCPEGTGAHFREDEVLRRFGSCGFLGIALKSSLGEEIGVLALLHEGPLEVGPRDRTLLDALAACAGAELERLRSQADLARERDFLHNILNTIQEPIFIKNREHQWVFMNDAFCRFLNRDMSELLGRSDYDVTSAQEAEVFWQKDELVFKSGQPNESEESRTGDGNVPRTLITKKAVFTGSDGRMFLVGLLRDITPQRRLETQLRLADRMATVGTMASGVAHEINNPLSYVSANLSFLREQLSEEDASKLDLPELREVVAEAIEGTGRVRAIVQDMKTFTRSDEDHFGPVDIHQVIEGAQRLVRHQLQHYARLECELEPVPPVSGNQARLGQVVVNLLVNALQAFPRGDPQHNRIRVSTRRDGQGRVVLAVEDNGTGMPPEVLERLFTPFFSTKPVGVGTGLGLAICHSIVQSMGGNIEVDSTQGKGSTFRLLLPVFVGEEQQPSESKSAPGPDPLRRRLLIIDDEPSIGASVRHLLQALYQVDVIQDARAALQLIAQGERYDAILCDVLMPGLSGMDFVTELERLEPRLARHTGLMTGAVITPQTRAFISARASDYLQKPFEPERLIHFVERLLD